MKTLKYILIFPLISLFLQASAMKPTNGLGGGAWGNNPTWVPIIPACGDTLVIKGGDTVSVMNQQDYTGCGTAMWIVVDGTLSFPSVGPKLRLPAGSGIIVNAGGLITFPGPGAGNGNTIEIGGGVVWQKGDGDFVGPGILGSPLPIKLLSFDVTLKEELVQLKWITATEINNDYFTIERSSDANEWEVILTVAGAGNSNQVIEYSDTDNEPLIGMNYYRLKQTDFDGKFSYSHVTAVNFEMQDDLSVALYPNPAINQITIEGNKIDSKKIKIYNAVGQDITRQIKVLENYESKTILDLSQLKSGIYYVKTNNVTNKLYKQ